MPKLSQTATEARVEFVFSVPFDLMNAMYFTSLVEQIEGIDGWPEQVRKEMAPDLRAELNFLFTFPKGDPGIMGTLTDRLFAHREAWPDVEALLRFVRELPAGIGKSYSNPGVQGLAFYTACSPFTLPGQEPAPSADPRAELGRALDQAGVDADATLALYDRPEELRERMAALIERFYEQHYRHDLPRRLPCLERSVAFHRSQPAGDMAALARRLTGRTTSCLERQGDGRPPVCAGPYAEYIFVPSLDMGPYVSCADVPPVHGLFYPCEAEFQGAEQEAEATRRLARLYRALSDEQRLRILRLLAGREMYAQEIVEQTGLHQPVVSRHLTFMTAVGLLRSRRQNNMKFFSLNPAVREELGQTLQLFPFQGTTS